MNALSLDRFRELAEAYGADPARWPPAERAAAKTLLAHDARAQAIRARATSLDTLLASDPIAPPRPQFRRAILLAARSREGLLRALWHELGGLRVVGPALAASLVLGISAADLLALSDPATQAQADAQAPGYAELALLNGSYEDYLP